ncbi:hypothetical protein NEF87_003628 [Candidatus Lokiarchaeum ossiferum]|uniref:Metal-dependent hydrolase n=1 Tax=Candidatus Lokiarchaeum ossiferum TaxID=2951803 RepID=A0ABY6HVI4_9ARCH|nr:hypothetical protein NEF87_003628 [Candidatus Lokiarchaeum sp. B-35]
MDLFTHAVVAALLYGTFGGDVMSEYYLFGILFAILPDFDLFLTPLKKIFKADYLEHRGGSHSYIIGLGVALIGSIIFSVVFSKSFFLTWILGSLFYGLHISMDLLTTTLIPIFYPISKKEYSFYVEKAGSMFTMVSSVIIASIGFIVYQFTSIDLFRLYNGISLLLFIGYYGYRSILRRKITSKLVDTQKYFPGVLPHHYYVYNFHLSDKNIELNLEKGTRSSSRLIYLEEKWDFTPQEMKFYEEALHRCNDDYYRKKWTKIPKIVRDGDSFQIRFSFLETMMNGRSMARIYHFNLKTEKLFKISQNYERIYSKPSTSL